MNHQQAVDAQLPELYAFGDVPTNQLDEFEDHLADCSECLAELQTARAFAANAHSVFRKEAKAAATESVLEPRRDLSRQDLAPRDLGWWRNWRALSFSGALNAGLAGIAAYCFLAVIPNLRSHIQSLEAPAISQVFVLQESRSGDEGAPAGTPPVYTVANNSLANFRLDLKSPARLDGYVCEITNTSNSAKKTYSLHAASGGETLNLSIPVAGLAPGDYQVTLRVSDDPKAPLASFVLRISSTK